MAQAEDAHEPGLHHRIVAAAGASILSALLVNPLDVVKTRVQAKSAVIDAPVPTCLLSRIPHRFPVRWAQPSSILECQTIKLPSSTAVGCMGTAGDAGISAAASHLPRRVLLSKLPMSSCACALKVTDIGLEKLGDPLHCHTARPYRPVSVTSLLREIVRKEGVSALWRGTDTAMLASIPMVGVYMPLYDYLLQRTTVPLGGYAPLLAGSVARMLAVLLVGPLELVRTRQQGRVGAAGTAWSALREAVRETTAAAATGSGGVSLSHSGAVLSVGSTGVGPGVLRAVPRLWTGVTATMWRDVPFSAMYWGLVERIRGELLLRWRDTQDLQQQPPQRQQHGSSMVMVGPSEQILQGRLHHGPDHQQQQQQQREAQQYQQQQVEAVMKDTAQRGAPNGRAVVAANLIAGSISGAAAALVTTPFDVIKTQMQVSDRSSSAGSGGARVSLWEVGRQLVRDEGAAGLFRGWAPRAARAAPACSVVLASYETLKMLL